MIPPFKTPCLAKCSTCSHVWPAAWLPMQVGAAASTMQANARVCPACGTKSTKAKPIVIANEAAALAWSARHPAMAEEVKT